MKYYETLRKDIFAIKRIAKTSIDVEIFSQNKIQFKTKEDLKLLLGNDDFNNLFVELHTMVFPFVCKHFYQQPINNTDVDKLNNKCFNFPIFVICEKNGYIFFGSDYDLLKELENINKVNFDLTNLVELTIDQIREVFESDETTALKLIYYELPKIHDRFYNNTTVLGLNIDVIGQNSEFVYFSTSSYNEIFKYFKGNLEILKELREIPENEIKSKIAPVLPLQLNNFNIDDAVKFEFNDEIIEGNVISYTVTKYATKYKIYEHKTGLKHKNIIEHRLVSQNIDDDKIPNIGNKLKKLI